MHRPRLQGFRIATCRGTLPTVPDIQRGEDHVDEAIAALETALEELRTALETLPDEMSEDVEAIIDRTEDLLDALRLKSGQPPED
jgi:enamine deaminase RidA (YjgF/YER057c/UK114 family)